MPLCVVTFALRTKTEIFFPTRNLCGPSRQGDVVNDICTVMCVHKHLTLNDAWTSLLNSWYAFTKQEEFLHIAVRFYLFPTLFFSYINMSAVICVFRSPPNPPFSQVSQTH